MKTAKRSELYYLHSAANKPQITVKPGEQFLAETELNTGGWLKSPMDHWTPDIMPPPNPCVCVGVEGAKTGSVLAVEILDIIPDPIGYTAFTSRSNPLADRIRVRDWGVNEKTVRIADGFIHWDASLKIPISPMIGTLGTAPAEESLSNARGGPYGGNMDVQEVRKGSTVYLPVEAEGALLHIGDVHAVQGDGEINCAGGIECRSVVRLRCFLRERPPHFECVRIEDAEYIMTAVCGRAFDESFYLAADQLLYWMEQSYSITAEEGYLLMGQLMEARCTQFVNPTGTYLCKMPKRYLEARNHK